MNGRSVVLATTRDTSMLTFYKGYLEFLVQQGWDVTVVASSTDSRLEEFASKQGAKGVALAMEREPSPAADAVSLIRWVKLLRSLRPDVVVAATPKASLLALTAARIASCPVRIHQLWGLRFETAEGWRKSLLRGIERVTAGMATTVICNSRSLADAAKNMRILGNHEPLVLGDGSSHGVDLDHFARGASFPELPSSTADFLADHAGYLIVGFVGRITPDKGLDVLLDALALCHAGGARIACVVVGSSEDQQVTARLQEAQSRMPIHLTGHVTDPRPFFNVFDLLCLPSRREGFPNVVLEAAAMQVPAIVTDSTGTIDSVVDGETGRIVATDNVDALVAALMDAAASRERWADYGDSAHRRVVRSFSKERIWNLQEAALRQAVESPATAAH
jgi:glycosyltransferase involved in cell wall biosynthesis